ncbi:MAG: DUF4430 domain-containing protein [Bacteroidales bacterium]|nr:DUF4430 domain-containing protein [Bacteroidales bacterium]
MKRFLSFLLGLILAVNVFAQVNPADPSSQCYTGPRAQAKTTTVTASDIQYWIGTGSNSAILVVSWAPTGTPNFAWGFHWNGTITADAMMDSIAEADSRLSINNGGSTGGFVDEIAYTDNNYTLSGQITGGGAGYWMYAANNAYAPVGISGWDLQDGDVIEWAYTVDWSNMYPPIVVTPATNPNAGTNPPSTTPVDATIAESDILYWVGSGSNSARFIVNWADTCLAWGYHFNGSSVNLINLMDSISAADPRFSYHLDWGFVDSINYVENGRTFAVTPNHYFSINKNGVYTEMSADIVSVANGEYIKFGDETVSTWLDSTWYGSYWAPTNMVWEAPVHPVSVPAVIDDPDTIQAVEADIAESDILYWVGTGSNSARLIINWADPDTALAWGYHFNSDSVSVSQMLSDIAAADPRLTKNEANSFVLDLIFTDGATTLQGLDNSYWMYNVNGEYAPDYMNNIYLHNGDMAKFGDMESATVLTWDYGYPATFVWEHAVTPVPVPTIITPEAAEADIAESDILYWVGTGSNSARLIINWADPDTALAWGYHFNSDSVSVSQMLSDIAAADPRLTKNEANSFVLDLIFTDGATTLQGLDNSYWMYNVNGEYAPDYMNNIYLHNGDMAKFGDMESATVLTWDYGYPATFVWEHAVTPVPVPSNIAPEPEEATIAESDILFWIGQGIHNYTLIVNWADTALAWGYRSYIDSVSVKEVMDQVMVNDPRFSYVAAGGFVNDIYFVENGDTLAITPGQYWSYNVNGNAAQNLYTTQYLHDHDMAKWGDPSVATVIDSAEWGGVWYPTEQVWTMTVHPASAAEPEHGPFCGAVGSEGCNAIPATSSQIVAWASACTLDLGYQNIATQGPRVSYGEAADATGACDTVDNLSVVSLGDGGSATLTFQGHIYNGDGPDFAVYENGFGDSFLELAFVEVSSDGEHFVRFPATSLTQTIVQVGGIGTLDPTNINNLAGKYRHGWGTPFDLDELRDSANLDINHITHVRIVDVVGSIDPQYATYDAFGHIVNDPWPTESYSSGFDLDGIAVMHLSNDTEDITLAEAELSLYPNPAASSVRITYGNGEPFNASIYDLSGRLMLQAQGSGSTVVSLSSLSNGVYMIRIHDQVTKLVVRH